MTRWQKFVNFYFGVDKEYEDSIKAAIKAHAEFICSLDARQLQYYNSLHGQGRIKWDVVKLEKRIYELEKKLNDDETRI